MNDTASLRTASRSGHPSRYSEIAKILFERIATGECPVGSQLPTEQQLAEQFAVSRHTVRDAIRKLKTLGLVSQRPGVGTLVEARTVQAEYVQSPDSIGAMLHFSADTRLLVSGIRAVTADEALAGRLGCAPGTKWLRVVGSRIPDGFELPICWTEIYLNAAFAAIASEIGRHRIATYRLIEARFGEKPTAIRQDITACALPARIARVLAVPARSPGLLVTRRYAGRKEAEMQITRTMHPAQRFSFSMQLRLGEAGADGMLTRPEPPKASWPRRASPGRRPPR